MTKASEVWAIVQELSSAPAPFYIDAFMKAMQDTGMAGLRFGLLSHVFQAEPDTLSAAKLQYTIPYYATEPFEQGFLKLAENGFLEDNGAHEYRLSKQGRQALITIFDAAKQAMQSVETQLPYDELATLHHLLRRLDEAAAASEQVSDKRVYSMSHHALQSKSTSILSDITDHIGNLIGFCCDAHRNAWLQKYVVSAPAWEALTTFWRGLANSNATLVDQLLNKTRPTRGYSDYSGYLNELLTPGWIEFDDAANGTYRLTELGKSVRQVAEDDTDALFYAVWSALSENELDALQKLSQSVCERLQALVPKEKAT